MIFHIQSFTNKLGKKKSFVMQLDFPEEGIQMTVDSFADLLKDQPIHYEEVYIVKQDNAEVLPTGRIKAEGPPDAFWTPDGWGKMPYNWLDTCTKIARAKYEALNKVQ